MDKPRLLLITGKDAFTLDYFRVSSLEPVLAWLRCHFEVNVLEGVVDEPGRVLREFRPEMVLMLGAERGLLGDVATVQPGQNPFGKVPLAAYSLMDADSPAKMELFADLQRLGVEVLFTVDPSFIALAPMHRARIVYCPWFLNRGYCRDYGEEKLIPIGLYGQGFEADEALLNYPWRARIAPVLRRRYPVLSIPTPNPRNAPHDMVGENYARWVNRTRFVFACGGPRHVFVKKHLEIPACGSCLAAEPMAMLGDLGFRDMENCVLVTPENVVERLDALFAEPGRILEITARGLALVEARHTPEKRDTLARWLEARQAAGGPDRIAQVGFKGEFAAREDTPGSEFRSPFTRELSECGRGLFGGDDPEEWEAAVRRLVLTFPRAMEPRFFLALCQLRQGQPRDAMKSLALAFRQGMKWGVTRPDPALWGLYVLTHLALGRPAAARLLAEGFPEIRHPLLTLARARCGYSGRGPATPAVFPCSFIAFPESWGEPEFEAFVESLVGKP